MNFSLKFFISCKWHFFMISKNLLLPAIFVKIRGILSKFADLFWYADFDDFVKICGFCHNWLILKILSKYADFAIIGWFWRFCQNLRILFWWADFDDFAKICGFWKSFLDARRWKCWQMRDILIYLLMRNNCNISRIKIQPIWNLAICDDIHVTYPRCIFFYWA